MVSAVDAKSDAIEELRGTGSQMHDSFGDVTRGEQTTQRVVALKPRDERVHQLLIHFESIRRLISDVIAVAEEKSVRGTALSSRDLRNGVNSDESRTAFERQAIG
jgi:hypothetical protein